MPNVALLIPIAEVFEITVTELLRGERMEKNEMLGVDEVESIVINSLDSSVRQEMLHHRKKWLILYLFVVFVVSGECFFLLLSENPRIGVEEGIYVSGMMLLAAGVLCFCVKDILPGYDDENKVNFVAQGFFRVNMVGLAFNNSNWSHVCKIFRSSTMSIAVLYPIMLYFCVQLGGSALWNQAKYVSLVMMLLMMMFSAYMIGKKYE